MQILAICNYLRPYFFSYGKYTFSNAHKGYNGK